MSTSEEKARAFYDALETVRIKNRAVTVIDAPADLKSHCLPIIEVGEVNHDGLKNTSDRQSFYSTMSYRIVVAFCTERNNRIQKEDKIEMLNIINEIQEKTFSSFTEKPIIFANVIDGEYVYGCQLEGEI